MRAFFLILPMLVVGCAGGKGEFVSKMPVQTETFASEYSSLANCSYQHLDGTGIQKADLPEAGMTKLALESDGVRYWQLTFTGQPKNQTRVELTATETMFGAFPTSQIWSEVRSCSGQR